MPHLRREGLALFYVESPPEAGSSVGAAEPALLFVHGWCCDHTVFAAQMACFGGRRRCVAVDLRGHGRSAVLRGPYSIAAFADDLAWLCDELGIGSVVAVGHSLGGVVALALAVERPALVAAVVALAAPIVPPAGTFAGVQTLLRLLRLPGARWLQRRISRSMVLPADDPVRAAELLQRMAATPRRVAAATLAGLVQYDSAAAVAACTAPLLVVSSAAVTSDLPRLRVLCGRLTTGQTVGSGHFLQLDVPEQVNAMIARFLAVTLPTAPAGRAAEAVAELRDGPALN